jgi:predicted amidohydrolase
MNIKTITAIALSNRDYSSLDAKLAEAVRWTTFAARQGAELVVLPEALNLFFGDGDEQAVSLQDAALDDWRASTRTLIDCARANRVALTIPVIVREAGGELVNCFYLISAFGEVLGRYEKMCPTPSELDSGVRPGKSSLMEWEGLKVGGAICFDCYYPHVFEQQADAGAQLFLMPSLTPGGRHIDHYAMTLGVPIVVAYPAYSRIVDLDGRELAGGGYRHETLRFGFGSPVVLARVNFDRVVLFGNHNQEKIVEIQETYGGDIGVAFDQDNCTFIVESRSENLKIGQVIERFGLIPQRKYFRNCATKIDNIAHARSGSLSPWGEG